MSRAPGAMTREEFSDIVRTDICGDEYSTNHDAVAKVIADKEASISRIEELEKFIKKNRTALILAEWRNFGRTE